LTFNVSYLCTIFAQPRNGNKGHNNNTFVERHSAVASEAQGTMVYAESSYNYGVRPYRGLSNVYCYFSHIKTSECIRPV